ncbi:hypothetical protein O6H91_04G108000 [Diphasiastrum complanatum]|uniref:Uncharacterized protein n=1 Tax=Diphasiastrum complanatum TaxID=34168 RepID=A0ACC2E030_DIPCM|nr:hypothetical protein O6H91_04G108000 [Diphasiastrum complanatum]
MSTSDRGGHGQPGYILQDIQEKKKNLRQIASEVGIMAAELQDVRKRMAAQESALVLETSKREMAELNARNVERQLEQLHKSLDEKNIQAQNSALVAEQYLKELVDARGQLADAQALVDSKSESALSAQFQLNLSKELEEKALLVHERDREIVVLKQQLSKLRQDLHQSESSQKELRGEVERLQAEVQVAIGKANPYSSSTVEKFLGEVSSRSAEQFAVHLNAKNEEITRLKEEVKLVSAQLNFKALELKAQVLFE